MPDPFVRFTALAQPVTNTASGHPQVWLLLLGYGVVIAVLAVYAAHVALSTADASHRADAYKVLKLIWGTATGTTGLLAAVLHLNQAGLM